MRERERERERDQPSDDMHNDSIWNFCSKNIHIFFRQRAREKAIRIFTSVKCSKNRSEKKTYTHKVAYEFTGEGAETRTMYADLNRSNANTEINKSERECGGRKRQAHSNRIRSSDIHWYILFEMSFVLQKHTHTHFYEPSKSNEKFRIAVDVVFFSSSYFLYRMLKEKTKHCAYFKTFVFMFTP